MAVGVVSLGSLGLVGTWPRDAHGYAVDGRGRRICEREGDELCIPESEATPIRPPLNLKVAPAIQRQTFTLPPQTFVPPPPPPPGPAEEPPPPPGPSDGGGSSPGPYDGGGGPSSDSGDEGNADSDGGSGVSPILVAGAAAAGLAFFVFLIRKNRKR